MSFADDLRGEFCGITVKKPCCRRSLMAGLMLSGVTLNGNTAVVRVRYEIAAQMISDLFPKLYAKEAECREVSVYGHRAFELTLSSAAAVKLLRRMQEDSADPDDVLHVSACTECLSCFLRGVFLANGTVNDPHKPVHMEFSLPEGRGLSLLCAVLERGGYETKTVSRGVRVGVYFKNLSVIGDLVTQMGGHRLIFDIYNAQIERDIRNNENRATNCVARNIQKTVEANAKQVDAIGRLMGTGRFDALPAELKQTALLRYQNPDVSLDALKDLHEPPISKSGLSHRLRKIIEESEK